MPQISWISSIKNSISRAVDCQYWRSYISRTTKVHISLLLIQLQLFFLLITQLQLFFHRRCRYKPFQGTEPLNTTLLGHKEGTSHGTYGMPPSPPSFLMTSVLPIFCECYFFKHGWRHIDDQCSVLLPGKIHWCSTSFGDCQSLVHIALFGIWQSLQSLALFNLWKIYVFHHEDSSFYAYVLWRDKVYHQRLAKDTTDQRCPMFRSHCLFLYALIFW